MVTRPLDLARLTDDYRAVLRDAGYWDQGALAPARRGVRTFSLESFERFAGFAGAPAVMAAVAGYVNVSGVADEEDFSLSCLPGSGHVLAGQVRACTLSVGMVEVLVVNAGARTGEATRVILYVEIRADVSHLVDDPAVDVGDSRLDGGGRYLIGHGLEAAQRLLNDAHVAALLAARVTAMRRRQRRFRRADWHNSWLWAAIDRGVALPASSGLLPDDGDETLDVTSQDVRRLVGVRTSQSRFRRLLLARQTHECAYCGLAFDAVLEAAHLIPHGRGGPASLANGRLLCPNHHRAFDLGLMRWTGDGFEWVSTQVAPF
jgi:hypothetical protein